ncbi:MAG: transcription termination factor NusA [Nitrospiraceae bacterium]|nr:transcription termination factor NusA [Nitrospiraceae bacterium]
MKEMTLIDQICREKGISKDVLISALEAALLSAARKRYGGRENIHLKIDPESLQISVFETSKIVDSVQNPDEEISEEDAKAIDENKFPGDELVTPLTTQDFGRIAAQTAKQIILQKMREAERDVLFNEFKDKVGQIVSGTVIRKEKGAYFINIGKTEVVLPLKDALPGENPRRGDFIKAYIEDIKLTPKGPSIHVTRTDPRFVAELFRMEVPEIAEGLVKIKDIVREPGERTKIAVYSRDQSIDPVGACVGMKGTRVQSIVREIRGERIDIIPWTDDPRILIARALSPAVIDRVGVNEDDKTAMVVVSDQQLSIAIGKKGQNVRLAMKLTGWDIDIISDTEYAKIKMEEAEAAFGEATRERKKPEGGTAENPERPHKESEGAQERAPETQEAAADSSDK